MNIAVMSANLGNAEAPVQHVAQVVPPWTTVSMHLFTDETFPPRRAAMTPRLQSKLPKLFGWEMVPDSDVYVWIDAAFRLAREDSIIWLLRQLADHDIVFFEHPERQTIEEEAAFLRDNLATSQRLQARYQGELLDEQMEAIRATFSYDEHLYASGIFAYRPIHRVKQAMKEWWFHISRYHLNDQLSLPYALASADCDVATIDAQIGYGYHEPHFEFTRTSRRVKRA
jgi:hypothetical protein